MQKHVVDQDLDRRLKTRKFWKSGLGILGIALLVTVALDSPAALNYLVPKVPGHPKGVGARVGWYLHSGQLQADIRTLAATCQFLKQTVSDPPAVADYSNQPVAGKAAPSSHKS